MAGRVRGRGTTAGVVAVCAAVLGMGLAACTPEEEPTPVETTYRVTEAPSTETVTPTPTATETPTLTPEEVNIEAAKQTVVEYTAAIDAVGAGNFAEWEVELSPFWGTPEVWEPNIENFSNAAAAGLYSEGQTVIASFELKDYTADPTQSGHERVTLEYCVDNSQVSVFQPDGTSLARTLPPRYIYSATLARQDSGLWSIASIESYSDRTC